jgi:hypothetical protein
MTITATDTPISSTATSAPVEPVDRTRDYVQEFAAAIRHGFAVACEPGCPPRAVGRVLPVHLGPHEVFFEQHTTTPDGCGRTTFTKHWPGYLPGVGPDVDGVQAQVFCTRLPLRVAKALARGQAVWLQVTR